MRPTVQQIREAEQVLDIMDEYIATIELSLGTAKAKRYELMEYVHVLRSRYRDSTPREHYADLAAESKVAGR